MICEHGKLVTVVLCPVDDAGYWDDGPFVVQQDGKTESDINEKVVYLPIVGCERCTAIGVRKDN